MNTRAQASKAKTSLSQVTQAVKAGVIQALQEIPGSNQPIHQLGLKGSSNDNQLAPGAGIARVIRGLCHGGVAAAQEAAAQEGYEGCVKALAAGDVTAGGILVEGQMANEVIDRLRSKSVIRRMRTRVVRMEKGTMTFPRLTTSGSASYVAENADIAISDPAFDAPVMTSKKLAALVAVSNDLLRFASDGTDQIITSDLVKVLATTEDSNFLRGDGTESGPMGLRYWANASNVTATNGTSATNIETDFKDLIQDLEGNDVPMERPHWLMAPRSKNHLITLRDANGNLIFPEMRGPNPMLHQWPVLVTTNIPVNLNTNQTEVYLVDASEVVIGEVDGIEITITSQGGYKDANGNSCSPPNVTKPLFAQSFATTSPSDTT